MVRAYPGNLSLTCLKGRVERQGIAIVLVLLVQFFSANEVRADKQGSLWPEVAVSGASDFTDGQELLRKRKWDEAAIVFRAVLRKNPEFSPAAMGLTRALAYSGRREEALSLLGQYVNKEKGGRRRLLMKRAKVLSRLFFTNTTFQFYQDGLNILLAKKYRSAREKLEKALEHEPDNVEILTRIGQCLVLEKDFDSAAERLRLAKRLNPYEPEVRLWLGRAMHQRGELNEAIDELRSAFDDLETSEVAPIWLAEALFSFGQKSAAMQILEEDVKIHPFHLSGLMSLARLRMQSAGKDSQQLWVVRKELQLLNSRLPSYPARLQDKHAEDGDLRLDLRKSIEELKEESAKMGEQVDRRLGELSGRS